MTILALEFSSPIRSVAVVSQGACLARVSERMGKSTGLALADQALRECGLPPSAIERLVVGLGPGSYAGVRSALAIVQGWQLAQNTPVAGVSSMEVLAETARAEGLRGPWTLVIDAQRNELYRALYDLSETESRCVERLRIVPAASVAGEPNLLGPMSPRFLAPGAEILARLGSDRAAGPAESLEPVYLREASFVKAPPPRHY